MSSEFLLMGGEGGGKTTFTGGLIYYLEEVSDFEMGKDYDIDYLFNRPAVERNIRDTMWGGTTKLYPDKTDVNDQYIVKIYLYEGTLLPEEYSIEIMDIPGEKQEKARNAPSRSLFDGLQSLVPGVTSEQDLLVDKYRNDLKPKIKRNKRLDDDKDEWEQLFKYRYLRSDSVILMLNLYKLEHATDLTDPEVLDPDWLDIASRKQRKLLLVTGCDVVGYDPDTFDGGERSILGGTVRDTDLVNQMRSSLSGESKRKVSRLLTEMTEVDSGFSVLGVSVPAEDPTKSDRIRTDAHGNLDIRGFERVVQWLKQ